MITDKIKVALNETFQALKALQDTETIGIVGFEAETAAQTLDHKKVIQKNKVISLECG